MRSAEVVTPVSRDATAESSARAIDGLTGRSRRHLDGRHPAPGRISRARRVGESGPDATEPAEGPDLPAEGPVAPGPVPFPPIVMTEFFTHGELDARGSNLAVYDGRHNPVPWRLLQVGPGDFCRIAFQTVPRQYLYKIYYGGKAAPGQSPAWTSKDGLLLETRRWKDCDLNSLDSVREALKSSEPLGERVRPLGLPPVQSVVARPRAVPQRLPRFPADLRPGPLSLLHVEPGLQLPADRRQDRRRPPRAGTGPSATPGSRARWSCSRDCTNSSMFTPRREPTPAWSPPGSPPGRRKPEPIPPEAFGSEAVAGYPAIGVKHLHEFTVDIAGRCPWPTAMCP